MKNFFKTLRHIIFTAVKDKIESWQFRKVYYYYDPKLRKGEDTKYVVDVYRFNRNRKILNATWAGNDIKDLMTKIRRYVDVRNSLLKKYDEVDTGKLY